MKRQRREPDEFRRFAKLGRATGFQYFKAMNDVLLFDYQVALREVVQRKSALPEGPIPQEQYRELGFWYRTLARSFLSFVEGLLYVMRQLTLDAIERGEIKATAAEQMALAETTYAVNVDGKRVEQRDSTNRLLENVVLTLGFFPPIFGSSARPNYSKHGWRAFQDLVRLRNDITHPKAVRDVLLQPELPNTVRDAADWFLGFMSELFGSADPAVLHQSHQEILRDPSLLKALEGFSGPIRDDQ